ncbi:MAG: hypothetical protein JXA18_06515 [Chitinispirillaceae bacterium]|nr:hypothetical protein [Chitinispirillaceae bacterium]
MLRGTMVFLIILGMAITGSVSAYERVLTLKIGPTWPRALQWSEKPTAWDASVHSGIIVDRIIAIGGGVDFLWNVNEKTKPVRGNVYEREMIDRTFMFPVSGCLALTPIPDYKFHPCASVQAGLNTMYFSHEEKKKEQADPLPDFDENGWYMGFYLKIAADAIFNIGEQSGLFAGAEYQWSRPKKLNDKDTDLFTKREMRGFGLRMGFRVLY